MGATRIEPGYPKDYTPEQMRGWAEDVDHLNRVSPAELDRWQMLAPEQLTPEQRRVLVARDTYYGDSDARLKGSLREDGTVEMDNGSHRVWYMQERGVDPIPVWVSSPDERRLDRFSEQCERELQQTREAAPARVDPPPRTSMDQQREQGGRDQRETVGEAANRVR